MIAVVAVIVVIVIVLAVGYAAGWFKSSSSSTTGVGHCTLPSTTLLKGEGSTLVNPLMEQWETSYWTGSAFTYDSAGSSAGIQAVSTKVVDFGASDAPLSHAQRTAAPGILQIPESAGGVVPIYNVPNLKASLNFNGSILAQIYDGQITNWNNTGLQALNPGVVLPVETIAPIYRSGGSGTTFIFTSFLSLENHYWNVTYNKNLTWPSGLPGTAESGNGGVADAVAITPWAIGYVDLNYAVGTSGIGIGDVQNPSGNFIRANVADTSSALETISSKSGFSLPAGSGDWYNVSFLNSPGKTDYPITSLTYLLVYQSLNTAYSAYTLNTAENLVDFLHWAITTGQTWSAVLYYVPLPTFIATADNTTINSMTFDGSTVPVCVPTGGAGPG
jgi:phosphate transport system substrate-binding protein